MKVTLKTPHSMFIPLRDAMLCVECEFITPAGNDKCSICGEKKLVSLAELLDVLIGKACDATPPIAIAELARLVPLRNLLMAGAASQKPA